MVRMSSARHARTRNKVFGMVWTMSDGLWMTVPLILNWPPAMTTTMAPKRSMLMGMPQKLPRTTAFLETAERVKSQKFRTKVP
ncbi:hypothetical protein D9M72_448730 [compost metagenome]